MVLEIYNQKQNFFEEYKSCCRHNSIKHILDFYNFTNSHLIIKTDYNFNVELQEEDIIIHREPSQYLIKGYNHYIIYPETRILNSDELLANDKSLLMDNIPIIIDVDTYFLDYDRFYLRYNCLHSVILSGFNDFNRPFIIDVGERVQYKGEISYDDYLAARSSLNYKGRNIYSGMSIEKKEMYISRDIVACHIDYIECFKVNLNSALEYYIRNQGIISVKTLGNLFDLIVKEKEDFKNEYLDNIYYQLYSINRKRKLFSLSLRIVEESFKLKTKNLQEKLLSIIMVWERVLHLMLKFRFTGDKKYIILKIIKYLDQLYSEEMKMYDKLNSILLVVK